MDYLGPDVEPEEVHEAIRRRRLTVFGPFCRVFSALSRRVLPMYRGTTKRQPFKNDIGAGNKYDSEKSSQIGSVEGQNNVITSRHVSFGGEGLTITTNTDEPTGFNSASQMNISSQTPINSADPTDVPSRDDTILLKSRVTTLADEDVLPTHNGIAKINDSNTTAESPESTEIASHARRLPKINRNSIRQFFKTLFTPASISIFISFPIALIPQVKALFVEVPSVHMPSAPDGQPPLAFILDIATFMGNASVPLGLICLGSALARLHVPRKGEWQTLPLGAISWLAIGKILIMPVFGVLVVQGLTKSGIIDPEDKVLRFVCM